jgi:hypothetical protein
MSPGLTPVTARGTEAGTQPILLQCSVLSRTDSGMAHSNLTTDDGLEAGVHQYRGAISVETDCTDGGLQVGNAR